MVSKFRLDTNKISGTQEAISRTLAIANNYAGELSIEVLPLANVELDPDNKRDLVLSLDDAVNGIKNEDPDFDRKKLEWKSLESLAKTIKDDQLINPIYVYRFGNKCRLIAGERRTLASAIAGKKEIIARIANQRPVGSKLRILQWIENNERSELNLAERVASLESILDEYFSEKAGNNVKERVTAKLLSDLTGISMTQARRYILILQSDSNVKKAVDEGKLENIKLIELICSTKNPNHKQTLLDAAIIGKSFEYIAHLKNELEQENKKEAKKSHKDKKMISIGKLNPKIAKIIIDALLATSTFNNTLISESQSLRASIHWNNIESVQSALKKIITYMERSILSDE